MKITVKLNYKFQGGKILKLATTTGDFNNYSDTYEEKITLLKEAGFSYIDLDFSDMDVFMSPKWEDNTKKILDHAEKLGMKFVQAHSPCCGNPVIYNPARETLMETTLRAFEVCRILGIKNMVVHNGTTEGMDKKSYFEENKRFQSKIFDWDEMCRVELPIPDIKVQQKIVDAYNSITKRIKIKQKINENLEKTAQTIYNKTIESNNENESMYMTTIIKNGFPFDSDFFNENKNGLPLIRIRDIKNCTPIVYTTEDFSRAEIIKSGDLLVGMDGEFSPNFWFGKDSLLNQRVCKLSPSNDNVHIFFIYFSIKPLLEKLEKTQGGTTVIHVGKKDFDKINFPRLSIKEHKCFYNNVNSSFRLLIKNKNEILKLQELKQLVISRISGM